jgi:hypothetical protein
VNGRTTFRGFRLGTMPIVFIAFAAANAADAEEFVFETSVARLVIGQDAKVRSLKQLRNGREYVGAAPEPFVAVSKAARVFQASNAERHGDLLRVQFGASGVEADYRITATPESIAVQLTDVRGEGVDGISLMQLNVSLPNTGGLPGVRWDAEFAVCLLGLSSRVNVKMVGLSLQAWVYPELAVRGERVALLAGPTPQFLGDMQKAERTFGLPSPSVNGTWMKNSDDVRTSYLFSDLTEANVDETIRYAKLGGFRYILVYSSSWSSSLGSYPINNRNFPGGEAGLKAVIDKCHAAGLKVGMHMLTSFVGKNDVLVQPRPSPWLLKDAEATLAKDLTATAEEVDASSVAAFPAGGFSYGPASDVLIDDEIVHYKRLDGVRFLQCVRGFAGTRAGTHQAGARIRHLVEYDGSYIADLRTPLREAISSRVAGLINRCGFDMIYFDGGEINSVIQPGWYWMGVQQMDIWQRVTRELLVQGSGTTHWTWHIFARATSDDYSAVAPKQYMDHHKIADYWRGSRDSFLPAELGWVGFLAAAPDHPATTPDEIEFYATRMLALDSAAGLETNLDALVANARSEEMLQLLGAYERLRFNRTVSPEWRQRLSTGEWHMTKPGEFHPVRYDASHLDVPGKTQFNNEFANQALKFRLRVAATVASPGDPSNITLMKAATPFAVPPPAAKAVLPGSMAVQFELGGNTQAKAINLTTHRALAVRITSEGWQPGGSPAPVLNVQLEDESRRYRDYYVDLNFTGSKTVTLAEASSDRTLAEFRPAGINYPFKAAMGGFDYGHVVALNLRWMSYSRGTDVRSAVSSVEALEEREGVLKDVAVSAGSRSIKVANEMRTGDYAEYWATGPVRVFNKNGRLLSTTPIANGPQLVRGENTVSVTATGSGASVFTAITLGN